MPVINVYPKISQKKNEERRVLKEKQGNLEGTVNSLEREQSILKQNQTLLERARLPQRLGRRPGQVANGSDYNSSKPGAGRNECLAKEPLGRVFVR